MELNSLESSKIFLSEISHKIMNHIKNKFNGTSFIDNTIIFNTIKNDNYLKNTGNINYNIFDNKFNGKLSYNITELICQQMENYRIIIKQKRTYFIKSSEVIDVNKVKKNENKGTSNKYIFNLCYYVNYTKTEYGYEVSYEYILIVSLTDDYIQDYKKKGINLFNYQYTPSNESEKQDIMMQTEVNDDKVDIANILINLSNTF